MVKQCLGLLLLFTSILSLPVEGQVSYGGIPASFNQLKSLKLQLPVIQMGQVNNFDLQQKDLRSADPYKKFTFAKSFQVDISPENSGVWEEVNGMKIWRVAIQSKGAYSLNILFDKAILPTGGSIFIYSPDHQTVRGAFNANNEQSSGMLPIYPLPGDEIVVEYDEPNNVTAGAQLHISNVNHGYKNVIGTRPLGDAGSCNMDVYCNEALPVSKEKQAVVTLVIAGTDLCTGTFVNNARKDKTPYLLTAGHCIQKATDAQQTVFTFNYESPFCGQGGSTNGYADQTMTGSILRARSDSLDFALVELEMLPPPEYRPYYAGWDNSKTTPALTRAIHHPKGDVKKVSVDNDPPGIASYNASGHVPNSFWWIKKWEIGTTESGSSGGSLFNESNLVVGTLTGGTATCDRSMDDYFSMFAFQWNYSSISTRQLKKWLDPANTGITKIEEMDPYAPGGACDHFSDVNTGEKYAATKIVNGRGYVSGHNSLRITSYAQEFNKTEQTTLSAFSVGFAKALTSANNAGSVVDFHIYGVDESNGMPGAVLKSFQRSIKSLTAQDMNLVILDSPLQIAGTYFIGYDINYNNANDTVAVYVASSRATSDLNKAFCRIGNSWQPFYWVPEINLKSSLLIDAYGCGTTFAQVSPNPVPPGTTQFRVFYPADQASNQLYLVNTGQEEYGRIILYDLLGRKISETSRILTAEPMLIDYSRLASAVYCVSVETIEKREVIKIKVVRSL